MLAFGINDVAVIDDGINENVFGIGKLKCNVEVTPNLNIIERKTYNPNEYSHATICAAIIKKYSSDANICSIKILKTGVKKGTIQQLIKALYWCAENNIRLINLSLGSIEYRDFFEIKTCINEIYRKGIIIIAACNNSNVYTVPASLTNVIGVRRLNLPLGGRYLFHQYSLDGIDISVNGIHSLKCLNGQDFKTNNSNSFAAPFITSQVFNILRQTPLLSLEEIKMELCMNAINNRKKEKCGYNPYMCANNDWIQSCMKVNKKFLPSVGVETLILEEADKYDYFQDLKNATNNKKLNGIIFITNKKISRKQVELAMRYKIKIWHSGWNANLLKQKFSRTFLRIQINIPVILFRNYISERDVLHKLNALFLKEGYNSIVISTDIMDTVYGSEYLPTNINLKKYLHYIYNKYSCDVFLIKIKDKEYSNFKIISDIEIIEDIKCEKIEEIIDENHITLKITNTITDKGINDIYTKILKNLV